MTALCLLRRLPHRAPAGEPAAGPARLLRRPHLRARRQAARRVLPHQLDRPRRDDVGLHLQRLGRYPVQPMTAPALDQLSRQHHPRARDRHGAEGQLRPPRPAARRRARRLRALRAHDAAQPDEPALARPRPLRALGRPRLGAALQPAPPHGLRPPARPAEAVPPVRQPDARAPRARRHGRASRRRPARSARASATRVGMAIAERHLAARFNRPGHEIVDHRTFVLAGDGDLMEGVAHEAASLAGHLGLGKLVCFYDSNHICLAASTNLVVHRRRGEGVRGLRLARRRRSPTATTSRRSRARPTRRSRWPTGPRS